MALVRCLQVLVVSPLLVLPFLLHVAHDLGLLLFERLSRVLRHDLLPIGELITHRRLLLFEFFRLTLILLGQRIFQFALCLLLIFFEALTLLSHRVANPFFHNALPLSDLLLLLSLRLLPRILELVVVSRGPGNFALSILLETTLHVLADPGLRLLQVLLHLRFHGLQPFLKVRLNAHFLISNLVGEQTLGKEAHLLLDVAGLLKQLSVHLSHALLLNGQLLLVTLLHRLDLFLADFFLVAFLLFNQLLVACLLPLTALLEVLVEAFPHLCDHLLRASAKLLLPLHVALALGGGTNLMLETLLDILDFVVRLLGNQSQRVPLLLLQLAQFVLLLALVLDFLLLKLILNLLQPPHHQFVNCCGVPLKSKRFAVVRAKDHLIESGATGGCFASRLASDGNTHRLV